MIFSLLNFLCNNFLFFALHFESGSVFPKPLSAKEEKLCFEKMSEGDKKARQTLIEHNLRLVAHIVKKYPTDNTDREDLISIGTVGLIKAVSTFDYTKGCRFATYGARCVENEILMHFRSLKKSANDIHFDEPALTDKDGNSLSLIDVIADETDVAKQTELNLISRKLYENMEKNLNERERNIIYLRYGLKGNKPLTQRETAEKLGISRSYVSRIEKKALKILKENIEEKT